MIRTVLLSIYLFFSLSSLSFAEDSRGRLPDGTAFRTDIDGTQVVDYIAELEVTIESLNQKITALENELKRKPEAKLIEKDLAPGKPLKKASLPEAEKGDSCPKATCPELRCPAAPPARCEDEEREIARLTTDLEIARRSNGELKTKIGTLNTQLKEERVKIAALEKDLKLAKATMEERSKRASLRKAETQEEDEASLNIGEALKQLKERGEKKINEIKSLARERDQIFKSQNEAALKLSPSQLRTKNGSTLEDIEISLKRARSAREIQRIENALSELEKIVRDDLQTHKRLNSPKT